MVKLHQQMQQQSEGVIYINLVDFDALYGHRNDPVGFARAVERFDVGLGQILTEIESSDVLCITADHGCDPTTPGTDHTREWVPLVLWRNAIQEPVKLGNRDTFADLGATVADYFGVELPSVGKSFLPDLF